MTPITSLMPRQAVPPLSVRTADDVDKWSLAQRTPETFTMLVFYRGYHCPVCAKYLRDLERTLDEFERRGVDVIAISSDTEERALLAKRGWRLARLRVGYGLDLDDARRWGLYISAGRGKTSTGVEEPALFTEPALYLVRADGTLYLGAVQTMPFARPDFGQVLAAIDKSINQDYPARGEVLDHHSSLARSSCVASAGT